MIGLQARSGESGSPRSVTRDLFYDLDDLDDFFLLLLTIQGTFLVRAG